jgi:hypothetical protein
MNKNALNRAFDLLTPDEAASRRILSGLRSCPERAKRGFPRFAVSMAAVAMFVCGALMVSQFLSPAAPHDSVPGTAAAAPLLSELVPYNTAPAPAEYVIFTESPSFYSYRPESPQIIENQEELQMFKAYLGIGSSMLSSAEPLLLDVDFSRKAVIAVFGLGAIYEYAAPIVDITDSRITISRRLTRETTDYDGHPGKGYFIVLDRELVSGDVKIVYDFSLEPGHGGENITPEELHGSGVRIFFNEQYELSMEQPGIPLRVTDRGWRVNGTSVAEDKSYLIINAVNGFGVSSSSRLVLEYLDGSGRSWHSPPYLQADMRLEPLGGDKWAVYHADPAISSFITLEEKLLATFTVKHEGVYIEIWHEDGYALL